MAAAPSTGAGTLASAPPKLPMAVRAAPMMTGISDEWLAPTQGVHIVEPRISYLAYGRWPMMSPGG
eukprot:255152-Prymnesium_polylepis.1